VNVRGVCGAAALLAATAAVASAAPSQALVIDGGRLATIARVDLETRYGDAVRALRPVAGPPRTTLWRSGCHTRFATVGLDVWFAMWGPFPGENKPHLYFDFAITKSARWHTLKGLHVGSSLTTLRRRYPASQNWGLGDRYGGPGYKTRLTPPGATEWHLTFLPRGSHAAAPVLVAWMKAKRVVALGIAINGH
jgi:hypothetical protein